MAVKVGTFIMPSSGPFSITGVGFKANWAIFLFSNYATENVWVNSPSAGIGHAVVHDSENNPTTIRQANVSEIWQGDGVAGAFLGDVLMWVRATRGSDGWAVVFDSFDEDGFTMHFAGGFASGAGGQRVYYLAGDAESWDLVASENAYVPASGPRSLGWEPRAWFGIGAGGNVSAPGATQSFALADMSVPAVGGGYFDEGVVGGGIIGMYRGILDPNVDVQSWYGSNTFLQVDILEPSQVSGVWLDTPYGPSKSDTEFIPQFTTGPFSTGAARMHTMILGNTVGMVGAFTPSDTVGVPVEVALPFPPECVVFLSPQRVKAGVANGTAFGATGYGFCDADECRMMVWGGMWNPPNPFQSNGMISSDLAWVSNAVDGSTDSSGAVGSAVSAGSARCTPTGFEYTTEINDASEQFPVLYWAIGPDSPDAPGFFRRVL